MNKLSELGFKGDIKWIYNEEGSGARYYNRSVYFPDDLIQPATNSGITIDPGLDLGNASKSLCNVVLNVYAAEGLLSPYQVNLLRDSIGITKFDAIKWLQNNKKYFTGKFLVPDNSAVNILEKLTAPEYWSPLVKGIPDLLKIKSAYIEKAVHTALLSMAYNRGYKKTIALANPSVEANNWQALIKSIRGVYHKSVSLKNRRTREADLIAAALEFKNEFLIIPDDNLKARPVTPIPFDYKEFVLDQLSYSLKETV